MTVTPGVMKYAVVSIDGTDYAQYAQTALVTGDQNTQTYATLVPNGAIVDGDNPTYNFQLAGAQQTPLATALIAAQGTVVDVVLQAEHGSGKQVATFEWLVPVIPFGGTKGQFRSFDVTSPVSGGVAYSTSV